MSGQRSLITATVDFGRDGLQRGHIRVPYSHDRSAYGHIPIPVLVARRGIGPTVLLTSGVHGDEYEGPIALMRLMRDLQLDKVSGQLIIIPALNFPACLAGIRTSPIDGLNLNRRFPGERNGAPTDMIAHYIETELMPLCDYCFDFHAGGASLDYLPMLIVERPRSPAWQEEFERLAAAFQPPRVLYMDMLGEDRVISAAAERHNVRFVTGEFGGGGTVNVECLRLLRDGLTAVLKELGVLLNDNDEVRTGGRDPICRLSVKGMTHYIFATRSGIFEPCFRLGDCIKKGQTAGYIHDPVAPWQAPDEIHFAGDGIALCIRTHSLVSAGDCLGHLGSVEP
jgi:predicted deacylase